MLCFLGRGLFEGHINLKIDADSGQNFHEEGLGDQQSRFGSSSATDMTK